ncbi:M1 family aminopeptidase (plasmid) [Coraliomargarita sp. W4R53]
MTTKSGMQNGRFRRVLALSLPLLLTSALLVATPGVANAANDPIDGARTAGDAMFPNVGNGGYDALHYDVDLAWTPNDTQSGTYIAGTIVASSTMTARADEALRSFSMDFEGLEIDTVTVNGADAAYERDIDASAIKYKLIVTPASPVSGEFTTVVTYHGTPSAHVDTDGSLEGWNRTSDGATFLGQPIGAMAGYPHNNTPADKATYTFTLDIPSILNTVAGTAPSASAAVSNGELIEKSASTDGSRTTWVWDQTKPMASELAIISIGRYDVIEAEFALSDGTVIPSWSFMDFGLSAANKTTISNRAAQLGTIIRNFETMFGPYPGKSTGVVVDSVPSGISYALETQDRSFFPSASSVNGNTLLHEIVHQWYGDNVSPVTWTDIWINEGMASWAPTYYNTTAGFGATTTPTETTYYNSWNNTASTSANWSVAPGIQTDSSKLYNYQTYTRGAQFWEALKVAIGDEAFFAVVEQWQVRNTGTSKSGADLKALIEEISGRDITDFYQDWILDADKPAWPEKLSVTLEADADNAPLERGDSVSYTLTAANTGRVALSTSVVSVDLSDVLDDATIDSGALPEGLTLEGTTLTWAVPATATSATAAATFNATISDEASGTSVDAAARVVTLGGTCASCTSSLEIAQYDVDSAVPAISGDAIFGATLSAVTEGWTPGTSFAYSWESDGQAIDGATDATFTIPADVVGKGITVSVTGSKDNFTSVTRTSQSTVPVESVTFSSTPKPTISGSRVFGQKLSASSAGWENGTSLSYQWLRSGQEISGATSATYVLGLADLDKSLAVAVTATKPGFATVTVLSSGTATIATASFPSSQSPKISGTAVYGKKLSAVVSGWPSDTKISYRWMRNGVAIGYATKSTYTLTSADIGKRITLAIAAVKPGYTTIIKTSSATATVAKLTFSSSATVKITGTAKSGKTLKANLVGWPSVSKKVTYAWYVDGKRVSSASTLKLKSSYVGKTVYVKAAVSAANYTSKTVTSKKTSKIKR